MLEKMQQSHFVKKYSVQFVIAHGKVSPPFYFWDNKPHECSQTWQVVRSEFDQMMLDNAREHGVDAHEGVHVVEVLFDGDACEADRADGQASASHQEGRSAQGDPRQGRRRRQRPGRAAAEPVEAAPWDPVLNKGAIWTYWEGAYRDTGRDEGATMVLQTPGKKGWFWYIPLHDNIVSVGVVAPFDYLFKGRKGNHEQTYHEEVETTPAVKKRIKNAKRVTGYFATRDYSYRSTQVAGDGWVLVGDAFGFLDPLYSSGVLLALKSGELAADAIVDGPDRRATPAPRNSARWGEKFNAGRRSHAPAGLRVLRRLQLRQLRRNYPELRNTVTDLLIGDLFTTGRQGVGADGVAVPGRQEALLTWNEGARRTQARRRPTSWCCQRGGAWALTCRTA